MNKLNIRNLCLADFGHNFNKTRQRFSDVILQEGSGVAIIPTLAKKITSELAEVSLVHRFANLLVPPDNFNVCEVARAPRDLKFTFGFPVLSNRSLHSPFKRP